MKLWQKIFLYTFALFELVFIVSTVSYEEFTFNQNLRRQIEQGLREQLIVCSSLEAMGARLGGESATAPDFYRQLTGAVLNDYAQYFQTQGVYLQVWDEAGQAIFNNFSIQDAGTRPELAPPLSAQRKYVIRDIGGQSFLFVASQIELGGAPVKVSYVKDISAEYASRRDQLFWLLKFNLLIALWLAAGLYVLTRYLTRPVRSLIRSARTIAGGDYAERVNIGDGNKRGDRKKNKSGERRGEESEDSRGEKKREKSGDEIGVLAQAFNQMAEAVESNVQALKSETEAKQRFIENLTHELKTPLTSIIGYADFLRSTVYDEKVFFDSLGYIYREGKRLETISEKLMFLLLLDKQELVKSSQNIAALCHQVQDILEPRLAKSGIKLEVEVQPGQAVVEPDLFKILLTNLLDNALKASPPGAKVCLQGYFGAQRELIIEVTDQGAGIPEADLARVFEPFFMADKARTRMQQGAGLGLALCGEIIKLHDGKITISSQEGQGTKVRAVFP